MKKLLSLLVIAIFIFGCGPGPENQSQAESTYTPDQQQVKAGDVAFAKNNFVQDGIEYLKESKIKEAIESFDNAIKQNPTDPNNYVILGETYMRLKDYKRAVDTLNAAERIAPDNGDVEYLLAVNYGLMGDITMAENSAKKSIELFRQEKNEQNFLKAVALLQGLRNSEETK